MAYSIGDVSRVLGITASALHYYEKEGLIRKPMEDSSGWRSYDEEDVYRLISVKKYSAMGVSLREIARQFSSDGMSAEEILERMREKRSEAQAQAQHYAALCGDIDRLVSIGEDGIGREGIVDIRPAEEMLVFRTGEGGVIPRSREDQMKANRFLSAQPAMSVGVVRGKEKDPPELALLLPRSRAVDYGIEPDGRFVRVIPGGMALHAVVAVGPESYGRLEEIFRPILSFAREHRFTPAGMIWASTLFVDCSGGQKRYYYDTYMVFE